MTEGERNDLFRELYAQAPRYAGGATMCGRGAYLVAENGTLLATGVSAESFEELQWEFPDATIYDFSEPEQARVKSERLLFLADREEEAMRLARPGY